MERKDRESDLPPLPPNAAFRTDKRPPTSAQLERLSPEARREAMKRFEPKREVPRGKLDKWYTSFTDGFCAKYRVNVRRALVQAQIIPAMGTLVEAVQRAKKLSTDLERARQGAACVFFADLQCTIAVNAQNAVTALSIGNYQNAERAVWRLSETLRQEGSPNSYSSVAIMNLVASGSLPQGHYFKLSTFFRKVRGLYDDEKRKEEAKRTKDSDDESDEEERRLRSRKHCGQLQCEFFGRVTFDPELHPALVWEPGRKPSVPAEALSRRARLLLFPSGKFVIDGVTSLDELQREVQTALELLESHRCIIDQDAMTRLGQIYLDQYYRAFVMEYKHRLQMRRAAAQQRREGESRRPGHLESVHFASLAHGHGSSDGRQQHPQRPPSAQSTGSASSKRRRIEVDNGRDK